ncbi:MAG: RNA methyltransferase [Clostridia bacterium]|nr:RNA methyltransferase [Clostridia bacterium]
MQLPQVFEKRMKQLLGAEYGAFYEALCTESAVKGLRVNRHKVSAETFLQNAPFSLTPLSYTVDGFIVSEDAQAGKHPYHHAGAYYMQDPGAMATVAALPAELWEQQGLKILDLCAAPGGKTTQLAALCAPNGGAVLANEYNAARSRILAGNVERMGLANVCVTNLDSKYLAEWYPAFFDLVVVDAPCSGEGMYRKNDLAISEWSPENVAMCAVRQKEILENAEKCVAAGGYLLYSTCTYSTEENEETVADFLARHSSFRLCACSDAVVAHTADGMDISGGKCPALVLCRRFYPHVSPGEGQFVALLRRDGDDRNGGKLVKDAAVPLGKTERAAVDTFLRETVGCSMDGLCLCGGNAAVFPLREQTVFPLPPFGVVSVGVTLGEVRKGRMVPHHHFFMVYGGALSSKCLLDLDDVSVACYLAGEEIAVDPALSGYTSLRLKLGETAVTLGGGKAVGGRLKNYYPKGLRVH